MNSTEIIAIENIEWAKQGGLMTPLFVFFPFYGLTKILQAKIGESFGIVYGYYTNGLCTVYFPQERVDRLGQYYLNKKEQVDTLYKEWQQKVDKLELVTREILKKNWALVSGEELISNFESYCHEVADCWADSGFVEAHDNTWHIILEQEIKKTGVNLSESEIETLLHGQQFTVLQEEEMELLRILDQSEGMEISIRNHAEKYFFIEAGYASGQIYTSVNVAKKFDKLKEKNWREELVRLEKLAIEFEKIGKEKEKIISQKNIPKNLEEVFHFFSLMQVWRDKRKRMQQIGSVGVYFLAVEIAKRAKIGQKFAPYIIPKEAFQGIKFIESIKAEIEKRTEGVTIAISEDDEIKCWYGSAAKEIESKLDGKINEEISELKGQIACKGKVTGRVSIISGLDSIKSFKEKDILVALMTRVEYMPAVRKAAAIVTDEGGITCHASIISRELGIPCIIGTKIATKVLKDGDMVEVDADKGVVRVLETT